MHAFFPPFGIYPNNAIVGGSADIAVGAALFKHVNRKPGIVIGNIGDASGAAARSGRRCASPPWTSSRSCGTKDAAVAADHELREQLLRHGRPAGRRDDGLQGPGPHRRRAEPRADARRARRRLQPAGGDRRDRAQEGDPAAGDGPVLLDTITYRFSGHSPSDASSYRDARRRSKPGRSRIRSHWCSPRRLVGAGVCTQKDRTDAGEVDELILKAYKKAIDLDVSPRRPEESRLPARAGDVLQHAGREVDDREPRC
jgi:2-oxoisovalerate dehydrogenase E1 component